MKRWLWEWWPLGGVAVLFALMFLMLTLSGGGR